MDRLFERSCAGRALHVETIPHGLVVVLVVGTTSNECPQLEVTPWVLEAGCSCRTRRNGARLELRLMAVGPVVEGRAQRDVWFEVNGEVSSL